MTDGRTDGQTDRQNCDGYEVLKAVAAFACNKMKKALDYVSDYQLESACKDAIYIAPFTLTKMIFAVLDD